MTSFSLSRNAIVIVNLADCSNQHTLSELLGDEFVSDFLLIAMNIFRVECEIASKCQRDYLVYVLALKLNKVISAIIL